MKTIEIANNYLSKNATTLYNETKKALTEWKQKSYFNKEKYKPEPYEMFRKADRLQNYVLAVGDAETTRCLAIISICSKILKIIEV